MNYAFALQAAIESAVAAAALLRAEYHRAGGPRRQNKDHADIDEEAEALLRQRLCAACPWSYLGEETGASTGSDSHHRWLVDPNDGTAAFLRGWRGSAISIAALRDGVPILGVVHAFAYPDDEGDLIAWAEGCPLTRNGVPISNSLAGRGLDGAIIFVSQDADRNSAANAACVQPARFVALPSIAYRLARVAAGDGVAAVSLSSPCSWDFAAGHALLRAAGGILVNEQGVEISYSSSGECSTRRCFGGSRVAVDALWPVDWNVVQTGQSSAQPSFDLVKPRSGHAFPDSAVLARAQGSLLGQLAGDSLGGLVEFQSPERIRAAYPQGVRDLSDGGCWSNLAGQPTDDSEMALMLARTLVHIGRYDRGAALDAYAHWWPDAWDRGNTLRQALRETPAATTSAERLALVERHANRSSQSNGCLMRISPLGVFGFRRPQEAAGWARADCRLTHPHEVCQDACAAYVAAVATAVAGGSAEAAYRVALDGATGAVRQRLEAARLTPPADYCDQMGWVLIALQNAFYQLLHADSLEEGVVDTVMQGGDTDTNAAIAGGLLGAVHGRAGIPVRWLLALLSCRTLQILPTRHPRSREFWPVDALELAEALLLADAH